jgi:hypothetical protein
MTLTKIGQIGCKYQIVILIGSPFFSGAIFLLVGGFVKNNQWRP